jgi:twitching motility protein PilJ
MQSFVSSRIVETIGSSLAISIVLFGISGWNFWTTYRGFKETIARDFRLQKLSDRTTYLDEVLTMSAYMAASSGDLKWVERYQRYEPELTKTIEELIQIDPTIATDLEPTKTANDKLIEYETRSFELLRQGKKEQANQILFGKNYAQQKQIYASGVEQTLARVESNLENQIQSYQQSFFWSVIASTLSIPLLVFTWTIALLAVRTYIRDRNLTQQRLLNSQTSLEELNASLEQQAQKLETQEQLAKQENEILQTDVGNLLDIVSAVEEGDLTVQAPVSDRVTGLVADTFNRLTEELAKVLGQVVGASRQVSQSASNLEEIAATVVTNAEQQAQGVTQALTLSEQVELSAQNATQQLQVSNQALLDLSATVLEGQTAMTGLTQGTEILRQGSDRIVQQMKTLGEFVGLAEQFVRDQGQIASQTQVLALNASLVAARAAEQQNPKQFAVAAKEFEAIADQVSKLAQLTNDGLSVLEQRTTQIQNVVSMVDAEVQNLGGLVGGFTQGVEQSTQVFDNVQLVATDAVRSGEAISQLNREIISSVQSTATAMRGIADIAQRTAQLTQNARSQSEAMRQLSAQLLERVEFFRLPAEALQQQEPVNLAQAQESTIDVAIAK